MRAIWIRRGWILLRARVICFHWYDGSKGKRRRRGVGAVCTGRPTKLQHNSLGTNLCTIFRGQIRILWTWVLVEKLIVSELIKKFLAISLTPVTNSTGSLIIPYISFRTVNFPCFLPYSIPVLHVIEWSVEAGIYHHLPRTTHTNNHKLSPLYSILDFTQ
jgi:hypothetical protein